MPYVVHWGQVLHGRLCVPPYKSGGVHTVLEDSSGSAVPVVIHHAAAADYPVGMEVALLQPCFMTLTRPDKCVGILVDNPASVVDLRSSGISGNQGSDLAASPGCSEHIGPVRIGLGGDDHNNGRRGLFATRDVRKGDMLMRGNPLATGEKKKSKSDMLGMVLSGGSMDSVTALIDRLVVNTTQQLIANLVKLTRQDPRSAHQLYSLAVADDPTKRIPSMELFDASSRKTYDPLQIDVGRIRRAVMTNVAGTPDGLYSGLYVLSSFMNHDCDPNCSVSYEGVTQEVRAHADVPSGEELTLGYFETRTTWFFRQGKSKGLHFACSCPRCRFEDRLSKTVPSFRDVSKQWHDLYEAHMMVLQDGITDPSAFSPGGRPRSKESVVALEAELEKNMRLLRGSLPDLTPQQARWIRRSFSPPTRAYSSASGGAVRAVPWGGIGLPGTLWSCGHAGRLASCQGSVLRTLLRR